jgi:threonine/homoserine/homoserine lactone efflux protein
MISAAGALVLCTCWLAWLAYQSWRDPTPNDIELLGWVIGLSPIIIGALLILIIGTIMTWFQPAVASRLRRQRYVAALTGIGSIAILLAIGSLL